MRTALWSNDQLGGGGKGLQLQLQNNKNPDDHLPRKTLGPLPQLRVFLCLKYDVDKLNSDYYYCRK